MHALTAPAARRRPGWKTLLASLLIALLMAGSAWASSSSNKWRLAFDHATNAGGEIELAITPDGGTATNVVITMPPGTHENAAARVALQAIRASLGEDAYHCEIDDGEDVLIKKHHGQPDFNVVLVRNTAEGLKLHIERE